ncbi:NUDIX hydrolase [Tissierella sp. MSJ-40]|uniref:NUDIX hydrolase n=1 Tax=Tissierella simiarum TaxID=2841534 RepID=A0ABS6E895_9FIRM|nr:NUDIX hydrolase [Tissierella simiarum]MBU5439126.1 NUDIX hydrolase [Tissierella simiarum]
MVGNIPLILCPAGVIILDNEKRVLLQHRTDNNTWGIPGGCIEPGETVEEAAKREVYEETGITVDEIELFNIYSGEEQHYTYPNGDEVYFINIVFITKRFQGDICLDEIESKDVRFFQIDDIPKEITPACIPVLRDLRCKIDTYFN